MAFAPSTPNPSIADVATLAGVSHQTVSRVLNNQPNVREQTKLRVQAAIAELGYRPNPAARALARGHGNLVGIVAPHTPLYGPSSMRASIEDSALRQGYGVTVASVDATDATSLAAAVNRLMDMRVRGIVIVASVPEVLGIRDIIIDDLPVVLLDGDRAIDARAIGVDQVKGAQLATSHLLQAGHRTVWHVTGPLDSFDARDRLRSWEQTLKANGAEVPPAINGDWTAESGHAAGQMLARMSDVTAVFAGNDQMALGLISALGERGLLCPRDISIVGFDDIPEAAYFSPPLTSIHQDFPEVARRAIESLIAQIEGRPLPALDLVEPRLVQRASVAAPSR